MGLEDETKKIETGGLDEDKEKHVDKYLKDLVKELHDLYHPEAVFMTQTSATLLGWSIKEAWKKAWPKEKVPLVFTINTREIQDKYQDKKLSKNDPGYEIVKEIRKKENEDRIKRIGELKKKLSDPSNYYDQEERESDEYALAYYEKEAKSFAKKRSTSISYEDSISPSGFSLQLSNEDWPEFIKLKQSIINKLKSCTIKGNVAIVDENAGYRKEAKPLERAFGQHWGNNIYEPKRGEIYIRNSQTLGIAKQAVEAAIKEIRLESKVVVAGYDPYGDSAGRKSGGPWTRYTKNGKRLPEGQFRRVQTNTEEGIVARERIEEFKKRGRDTGEDIKGELNI